MKVIIAFNFQKKFNSRTSRRKNYRLWILSIIAKSIKLGFVDNLKAISSNTDRAKELAELLSDINLS
jgi:hypothetical protein